MYGYSSWSAFDILLLAVLRSKAGGGNMTYHFPRRGASEKDTCVFLEYRVKGQQDEVKLALQALPGQSPLQVRVLKAAVVSKAQQCSVRYISFYFTSDTHFRCGWVQAGVWQATSQRIPAAVAAMSVLGPPGAEIRRIGGCSKGNVVDVINYYSILTNTPKPAPASRAE